MLLFLPQFQRAAGLNSVTATRWFEPIRDAAAEFSINTPQRMAAFIAQIGHESQGFNFLTESLYYKDILRIVKIFPGAFRKSETGAVLPAEIDSGRKYQRNPELLANRVYANRYGNGNEASGDGWKFRGRGLIQLTFRDNYQRCGDALGLDLTANPDLLLDFTNAARSAAWFFSVSGCNSLADSGDFLALTKRINSGAEGLADRQSRYRVAKGALCG